MARSKTAKSGHKLTGDTVTVATDSPPSPPSPTTRKKAAAVAAATLEPKKTKKQQPKVKESDDDEPAKKTVDKGRAKASRAKRAVKKEPDDHLKEARKVVDEISDTFGASSPSFFASLPLPGALSPSVATGRVMRVVVVAAVVSSALSAAGRILLDWLATSSSQTWITWTTYLGTTAAPGVWSPVAALGIRILKLTVAWGAVSNLAALNILSYGPIVYLLSSYYNVPLPAAIFSEGLDFVTDVVPIVAWRWLSGEDEADYLDEGHHDEITATDDQLAALGRDPATFVYSSVFAAVLYGFTFVQACRFFLPSTLVVHFFGIATVEPARTHLLSRSTAPTLYEVFSAVFLSVPAVLLNLACGIASRTFIFGDGFAEALAVRTTAAYRRTVALRAVALSVVVGLDVFFQCLMGIRGVDAIGAAAFASIWAVAPLLVGAGLGYAGV